MANHARVADATTVDFYKFQGRFSGLASWIFSTDHKRIGLMYLILMTAFFGIGMTLGFLMRLELMAPGRTIVDAQTYNSIFTLHGVIMVFLFVIPGLSASLGNFMLPIMIGAKDVQFPRLNLLSWWLFVGGALLAVTALFTGGGPPDTGWTFYAPYSIRTGTNVTLAAFAVFVLGFSSILTGLNFVTTIHRMRAPGMTFFRMPLFVWAVYSTGWLQVIATPIIGITLVLIMVERSFGIGVFDPIKGGDPILYQHLFWIYSHPAVYIMILPALGAISEMISVHARRTIFGYSFIALSSVAIALFGSIVWAHHMFVSGNSMVANFVFSLLTMIVAIPSAVKVFNWVATLYRGSIQLETPMLYSLSFIFLFMIGGFTGMMLGVLSIDVHVHDTYFVVGHFHYVIFGGLGFSLFGALHHWYPKMFGRMYQQLPSKISWVLVFVGFNVLYLPMFMLGWEGMPRRYYDYLPEFHKWHLVSTIGSWIMIAGILIMFTNLIRSLRNGPVCTEPNPWGGGRTLEWTIPSPPPLENFNEIPTITRGPYDPAPVEAK
ncbi:MAG: cytochrome c oxidase subunit I [Candidatus Krumholzibacteria bacterium]|nr:cytochrome c oxidase subunit I [Candidatus Krumholzibacteria bacterium]MDH4336221.1 cytochrome c oxidase subunit I [Candidatus Krumholzibacteria bacterium]MDH5268862.1 cytochrome c oxidase subunit I [Candidatus Krumholzibacteria bacterium]MDH5627224.1 cytochrome c oxidase subunit I [Candidatus Krumholzibacteria bacterium]